MKTLFLTALLVLGTATPSFAAPDGGTDQTTAVLSTRQAVAYTFLTTGLLVVCRAHQLNAKIEAKFTEADAAQFRSAFQKLNDFTLAKGAKPLRLTIPEARMLVLGNGFMMQLLTKIDAQNEVLDFIDEAFEHKKQLVLQVIQDADKAHSALTAYAAQSNTL